MSEAAASSNDGDRVLIITRLFDAPRSLVFDAWTNPRILYDWMGPIDHPQVFREADLRAGGRWRACLKNVVNGAELWQGGVYREIAPPERLVFTFAWENGVGTPGYEMLVTVIFEDVGPRRTKMTLRQEIFESLEQRDGHQFGWNSSFDRLRDYLAPRVGNIV